MNVRTPITMLILLGILLGAAYYGWNTIASGGDDDEPDATGATTTTDDTCKKTVRYAKGTRIKAKTITVNVYNAGVVTGLAAETLNDLAEKGFRPGAADNAPTGVTAVNVTILSSNRKSPQVRLVAKQFLGDVKVVDGPALGRGVSVIVGDQFKGMDDGAKRNLVLRRAVTACVQSVSQDAQPE